MQGQLMCNKACSVQQAGHAVSGALCREAPKQACAAAEGDKPGRPGEQSEPCMSNDVCPVVPGLTAPWRRHRHPRPALVPRFIPTAAAAAAVSPQPASLVQRTRCINVSPHRRQEEQAVGVLPAARCRHQGGGGGAKTGRHKRLHAGGRNLARALGEAPHCVCSATAASTAPARCGTRAAWGEG